MPRHSAKNLPQSTGAFPGDAAKKNGFLSVSHGYLALRRHEGKFYIAHMVGNNVHVLKAEVVGHPFSSNYANRTPDSAKGEEVFSGNIQINSQSRSLRLVYMPINSVDGAKIKTEINASHALATFGSYQMDGTSRWLADTNSLYPHSVTR